IRDNPRGDRRPEIAVRIEIALANPHGGTPRGEIPGSGFTAILHSNLFSEWGDGRRTGGGAALYHRLIAAIPPGSSELVTHSRSSVGDPERVAAISRWCRAATPPVGDEFHFPGFASSTCTQKMARWRTGYILPSCSRMPPSRSAAMHH